MDQGTGDGGIGALGRGIDDCAGVDEEDGMHFCWWLAVMAMTIHLRT